MNLFKKKLPVLVYHHVVPDDFNIESFPLGDQPYYSRFSEFYSHLNYLAKNDFQSVTIGDISSINKKNHIAKSVSITFDDGQISDYDIVLPALIERKMKATFYIITDFVGKPGYLSWKYIREMHDSGMEIGSHSCSHRCMPDLREEEIKREIVESRKILEDQLGTMVQSFSIPFGFADKMIINMAYDAGYRSVCTSEVKCTNLDDPATVYGRIGIRRGDDLRKFAGIVEMDMKVLGRLIAEDHIKSTLKRWLGRKTWHKFRYYMLLSKSKN